MKKLILIVSLISFLPFTTVTSTKCSCTGNTTQCNDGSWSNSAGSGTCFHHRGVK